MKAKVATAHLPDFVEPMKARLVDSIPPGAWIYEIKFDGYRTLPLRGGNTARLLSRNEKDLGKKFPEIINSIAALDAGRCLASPELSRSQPCEKDRLAETVIPGPLRETSLGRRGPA